MSEPRTYLRPINGHDKNEIVALARASRGLHDPWIAAPLSPHMFRTYLRRIMQDDHEGFALCLASSDEIIGVININNIVRGSFLSASLGYYVSQAHGGNGYMQEGIMQIKQYAFENLGLHRIEANIQPDNVRSLNLVRRCGFEREGLSRAFLYINGEWRDHERWTAIDPRRDMSR